MRIVVLGLAVLAGAAGCGKKTAGPANVTAEQQQEMDQQQKAVNAEEGQRAKQEAKSRTGRRQVDAGESEERTRRR